MKLSLPEGVCDSHVHLGTFPRLDLSFGLKALNKIMNRYHMASVLVSSSYTAAEKETRRIVKALRDNQKLYALIRSNPREYRTSRYLNRLGRLLENERIVGMKINPSTEKYRVTDDIYVGCLEVLNDHSAVLLLHCGRWVEMSGWSYGVEIAKEYSKIQLILAHMGGTHPDLSFPAIEATKNIPNIFMDSSQNRQVVVMKKAIEQLGDSRILFASDMPWGDYLQNLVGILSLELNEKVMNKILRENFEKIVKRE